MRNGAMILAVLSLAACSQAVPEEPVETPPPTTEAPAPTQSAAPTFWDLAPLGNGQHLRVHIDDRARAGDCDELAAEFTKLVEDEPVEGYTHEVLAYIETQARAADCAV